MPSLKKTNQMQISVSLPPVDNSSVILNDLESTIQKKDHLPHRSLCRCQMCLDQRFEQIEEIKPQILKSTSLEAAQIYQQIIDGLTLSGGLSLKLYIPDLFFVVGDCFEICHTSKQGRIFKSPGTMPLKLLYPTIVRLRRQYKSQLEQNFNKKIVEKVNPDFLHMKYYDTVIPSSFPEGSNSPLLQSNRNTVKRYILHKNEKYTIASLQEHKMNERQPFCLVMYSDGNCQLLNQIEFEMFTIQMKDRIQNEVLYFQSYIKYKKQTESILYSEYIYDYQFLNVEVDKRAELDIMILLGGLNKYDQGYRDLQAIQEIDHELMVQNPSQYVEVMVYKIAHYLAMASRIYVSKLKIKWIINDIGSIYLQQIMECIVTEAPKRIIKFRLPKRNESIDFYGDNDNFVEIYKDMKRRKKLNTLIIKKDINNKTYDQLLEIMNPEMKAMRDEEKKQEEIKRKYVSFVNKPRKLERLSQTIDIQREVLQGPKKSKQLNSSTYQQHLKQHPEFAARNMRYNSIALSNYSPQKSQELDKKMNNHFRYRMSSQDKKVLGDIKRKNSSQPNSNFESYFEKKRQRITGSVLYSTFSDLTREKTKQISKVLQHQKVGERIMRSSLK